MSRTAASGKQGPLPDGIEHRHIHEARGTLLQRWPFGLAGLGILLALAFLGLFDADGTVTGTGGGASLTVDGPVRIRNGNFYEMRLTVETRRDIRDVVLLVDSDLWYEVTVNTILPEPSEQGFRNGAFELRFGRLAAGDRLVVKVAAQINSGRRPSTNAGAFALFDGDEQLATVDFAMEVLP